MTLLPNNPNFHENQMSDKKKIYKTLHKLHVTNKMEGGILIPRVTRDWRFYRGQIERRDTGMIYTKSHIKFSHIWLLLFGEQLVPGARPHCMYKIVL